MLASDVGTGCDVGGDPVKTVFKNERSGRRRPWYVVGPSRLLVACKRAGGWSLDAMIGCTSFTIYGTDSKLMTYKQVMEALKDAEAYIYEHRILGGGEVQHADFLLNARQSKKRYYSE